MSEQGEKQFAATEHRREEFRKQGRFAHARDAAPVAASVAAIGMLWSARSAIGQAARTLFAQTLGSLDARAEHPGQTFFQTTVGGVAALVPVALAAIVAGAGVSLAQTGLRWRSEAVGFNFDKFDPIARLKQLFGFTSASIETGLSLLRAGGVGLAAWFALARELPGLQSLTSVSLAQSGDVLVRALAHVAIGALAALGIIAAIDYAQSWLRLEREMRMTRQELIDEQKQQDGDPKMKAQMRARARAAMRKRSIQNVRKAMVVVTNPTHVAVALRYEASDPAPIVVAKGHDELALTIRAEARKYGIPILENRKLARALDAEVQIGRAVPAAHFVAVARLLAHVFRLRGRRAVVAPAARAQRLPGTPRA